MKRLFILFALIMTMAATGAAREVKTINAGWQFRLGDDGMADEGWLSVGLPHSFSLPYFMSKDFYVGYGWYRKTVKLTKKDIAQYVSLEFDGVFQEAEVFVNGKKAGIHVGGYTGFEIDITPYAIVGDNEIKVRVNNQWKPTVAPRGGEHTFSGGIYRNVRLVKKSKAHIAWYGTRITTPTLESNAGKSSIVRTEVELEGVSREHDYSDDIPARPYIRYVADDEGKIQSFGKDNPTFATSSAEGHSAGMAADGNKETYWMGQGNLTLDTERSISLREVILTTDCGENDFRIELSNDNEKFSSCMSTTEKTTDGYRVKLSIPATCRYIRLKFSRPDVKLYEIEARGILR